MLLADLSWNDVAKALLGRTQSACQHYYNSIIYTKEATWIVKEENLLVKLYNKMFLSWKDIRRYFLNRHYQLIKEFHEKSELGSQA